MTMQESVRTVLSNYATFTGRASRTEFWWWVLAVFLASLVLGAIEGSLFGNGHGILSGIFSLAVILPNLAVGARRLHDSDRTGWWLLLSLIPILGTLVLIYFLVQPSSPGTNRFG